MRAEGGAGSEAKQEQPFPWLLAYFRQIYPQRVEQTPQGVELVRLTDQNLLVEALHLAYTHDGTRWTPLNGNRPVFEVSPPYAGLRDPFLRRGTDGAFHLLGTGGSDRGGILYSRSEDLVHWAEPYSLPVMRSVPEARNAWAPEFIHDEEAGDYLLYWSSSLGRYGWDDSRIWCARTVDFMTVSPTRTLFDPGFSVIDATIVPAGGSYRMFFKDERFGYLHGERRAIWTALAPRLDGPYGIDAGPITPTITEGPAVIRGQQPPQWYLYVDHCMDDRYGVAVSPDLLSWRVVDSARFPQNARHGSICPVTEEELRVLVSAYGGGQCS